MYDPDHHAWGRLPMVPRGPTGFSVEVLSFLVNAVGALRLQAVLAFAGAIASAVRPDLPQIPAVTVLTLVATLLWHLRTDRIRPHAGDVIG